MKYKKRMIISAVNIINGGAKTVLIDCISSIIKLAEYKNYEIIVLVNSCENLPVSQNVKYKVYTLPKKNYFFRLFYEYIYFFFLSLKLKPEIWFSLHDITPNVISKYQYVYMHNPSPFYSTFKDEKLSLKFRFFINFYQYVYKLNVKRNTYLIVQQSWFRKEISKLCDVDIKKIIIAYPEIALKPINETFDKNVFFYPSYPRDFKNFEIICKACKILQNDKELSNWNVFITLDGTENGYSNELYSKYSNVKNLHFIGLLRREEMYDYYNKTECLIFPSKLETWGLPISEFKNSNKKMIVSDLPYAHETANNSKNVAFFNPMDEVELARIMKNVITGNYIDFSSVSNEIIEEPFCKNWNELLCKLLQNK